MKTYKKIHKSPKALKSHVTKIKARGGKANVKGNTVEYKFSGGGKVKKEKHEYFVSVGNIGNITEENMKDALKTYNEYVKQSKSNYGRAGGEDVALFVDGEPVKEYFGTLNRD